MERDRRVSPLIPVGITPSGASRERLRIITVDISEVAAFSKRQIHSRKKVSKEWGVELSGEWTDYSEIKKKVSKEENWGKLQGILNGLSGVSIRGYIDRHRGKNQDLFAYLGVIAKEAGFYRVHRQMKFFYGILTPLGIPVKKMEITRKNKKRRKYRQFYYVVFAKHKGIIIDALNNNSDLQRFKANPVIQICGPQDKKIPNTYDLKRRERYRYVKTALDSLDINIKPRGPHKTYEGLFTDCPVPIFTDGRSFFYPVEKEDRFKALLQKKLG